MKHEYDILREMLKGLQQTVLGDARAARDSSVAPAPKDIGELVLKELRIRRERLKNLIRQLNEEAGVELPPARAPRTHHRCRGMSRRGPCRPV